MSKLKPFSLNPAVERLIKLASEQTKEPAFQTKPSTKAREALDQLFRQAQGLPELSPSDLALYRKYCSPAPAAPAHKQVEGGDPDAIREYAKLVREHVEKLNSLIATHRELLLQYSRRCFNWPVRRAKRKKFGDDADDIISRLQVGAETIANDPNARFDPTKKFGKLALSLIERIEWHRTYTPIFASECQNWPNWVSKARTLPPFPKKPLDNDTPKFLTDEEKRKRLTFSKEKNDWLKVIAQVLEDDLRDPEKAGAYLSLLTKPSYTRRRRREAAFFDKVLNEFETLWGSRRSTKNRTLTHSHANV